jgi:perosamine synthetase
MKNQAIFKGPLPDYNTIGEAEIAGALEVLNSGILSGFVANPGLDFLGGDHVIALEEAFSKRFDKAQSVSFNSATSALHGSLIAAGVDVGDEVIVPPYSMSATATAVLMCGAVPIFVDIEPDTFCMNPSLVESEIRSQTKAIIVVNLFGLPADLASLRKIADQNGLVLIEDNAQAPAALFSNQYAGTIGDMGVFSLNRHKTMQCGEGGVVICDQEFYAHKLRMVRNHGEAVLLERPDSEYQLGDERVIGFNYRLTSLQAAVALPQFNRLDELNSIRIELANYLTICLSEFNFLQTVTIRKNCTHVFYLYPILFNAEIAGMTRDQFLIAMQREGAPVANYSRPLHQLPIYAVRSGRPELYCPEKFPMVEHYWKESMVVTSICRPPLDKGHIDLFIEAIRKVKNDSDSISK